MRLRLTNPAIGVPLQPSERKNVNALLIGATTVAVMLVGWFGFKAHLRIEAWGVKMNELDRIFQDADQHDGGWSSRPIDKRESGRVSLVPTLKTPHYHA